MLFTVWVFGIFSRMQHACAKALAGIGQINVWIATRFNLTVVRVLQVEIGGLGALGFTMMQIGEWAASIACWFLIGTILLVKILAWDGVSRNTAATAFIKVVGVIGSVVLMVLLVTVTCLHKPNSEPWSNLQKLWQKPKNQEALHPQPVLSAISYRPYDLIGNRRQEFSKLFKPPLRNATKIRVGCISWSERACVAAGDFLILLSQTGWLIDENKVFRMEEPIPTRGVNIVSQPTPGPPLPPHLGRWHATSISEQVLSTAFVAMGVAEQGSSDASLPPNTTGVYFSVEPESLTFNTGIVKRFQVNNLAVEINLIENQPKTDKSGQAHDEEEWGSEAAEWLRANLGQSELNKFRNCKGIKAKQDYINETEKNIFKQ